MQLGFTLNKNEQLIHNKATSAMGIWRQRVHDMNNLEEKVVMNLGLACGHLCCKYPKVSVRHLLNHFSKPENVWYMRMLLWVQHFNLSPRIKRNLTNSYYFIHKRMPILLKTKISTTSKFTKDTCKNKKKAILQLENMKPGVVPMRWFVKDPQCIGFIYKNDLYCVTVEKFSRAVFGGTIRIAPSQKIGLILKITRKYTYAVLLHKGTFIKPGDPVALEQKVLKLENPFRDGIFGMVSYSTLIEKIPAYNFNIRS